MNDTHATAHNAIEWATAQLASTAYTTRCLAFVEDAVERANDIEIFGGDYAKESADLYGASANTGTPPLGAFVFYDAVSEMHGYRQNWGHVGLSIGNGNVIHAWDRVRIDTHLSIEHFVAPGGEALRAAGWAPLDRVLRGSVSKTYRDDAAEIAARMQANRFNRS